MREASTVVSGNPQRVIIDTTDTVGDVIDKAVAQAAYENQSRVWWEMRDSDGYLLDHAQPFDQKHCVFINLRAGIGA